MSKSRHMSISQLADITGKDRKTVSSKLSSIEGRPDGRAIMYDPREALPLLYGNTSKNTMEKKLAEEELKYQTARTEKIQIEVERAKGELVPIEDVASAVAKEYASVRAAILSIPSKMAQPLAHETDPELVNDALTEVINEALQELQAENLYEDELNDVESHREASGDETESSTSSTETQPS